MRFIKANCPGAGKWLNADVIALVESDGGEGGVARLAHGGAVRLEPAEMTEFEELAGEQDRASGLMTLGLASGGRVCVRLDQVVSVLPDARVVELVGGHAHELDEQSTDELVSQLFGD